VPGRRVVEAPHDVREPASGVRAAGKLEHRAHVLDEERRMLGRALLVARAPRQDQQALRARGTDVEEVALAVELLLAYRQAQARRALDLAPVVVREEGVGGRGKGELALLQPQEVDDLEPPRPDLERPRHLDAVRLWRLAQHDLVIADRIVQLAR
jgi:hypothetical protein